MFVLLVELCRTAPATQGLLYRVGRGRIDQIRGFARLRLNVSLTELNKFSKHRPSGPMLSISQNVHICVCLCVCLSVCSLLRYRLMVFLPPLPEIRCPIFLEIRNPWGKVMERSGLRLEHFCLEVV